MCRPVKAVVALLAAVTVWCGLWSTVPAAAQEVSPENRAKLEALFEELTQDPTDLDKNYEYAKLAVQAGDFEAAITAYERLLLFNPNLPRVKAELGVLYYRLGSYDVARAYLEQALTDAEPPPEVRARIEKFLASIEESQNPNRFSASLAFGARYQSNANYGPDGQILVFDILVDPDDQTEADEDVNIFSSLRGRFVHDFGNDAGDFFAVEANLYGSRQFEFTELDVEHLFIKAGPGFNLFPKDSGPVLFRPALRMTYIRLDDETYNFAAGASFRADWQAFEDTALHAEAFAENREYYATDERQNADTQDGYGWRVRTGFNHRLNDDLALRGSVFGGRVTADQPFEAYAEYGLATGLTAALVSPFADSTEFPSLANAWSLTLNFRYARRIHNEANTLVSAAVREDDDFRLDGTLAVPVAPGWSVFANLGYQDNRSTILNNEFQNVSAALGANVRF